MLLNMLLHNNTYLNKSKTKTIALKSATIKEKDHQPQNVNVEILKIALAQRQTCSFTNNRKWRKWQ